MAMRDAWQHPFLQPLRPEDLSLLLA
jgi:hypothetical protein